MEKYEKDGGGCILENKEVLSVKVTIEINFATGNGTSEGKNMIEFLGGLKDLMAIYCDKESTEEDNVRLFSKDILERTSPSVLIRRNMLYDAYKRYCVQNDLTEYTPHIFYQMMKDLGYREIRKSNGRFFVGVKIKQE
ncbi:MAG: hypothetical protein HFI19_09255 [Lachnospiraceae bacterium]|nr:hypothetical protein [Lachnospiraceae bacterium]